MPGLLRKLFGKPSKKTAAPVKQEYRPPVPHTDKERSADQNYRKRIMDQVTQLTKNAESAGGALDKEKLDDARGQFENMQRMARGMNLRSIRHWNRSFFPKRMGRRMPLIIRPEKMQKSGNRKKTS